MDDGELAAQIRRRPAIWDQRVAGFSDARRHRAAWLAVCRLAHPGFDRLKADDKRVTCLALQKRWRDMRLAYFRSARGPRRHPSAQTPAHDPELIAKLAFLAEPVPEPKTIEISDTDEAEDRAAPAAKRTRSSSSVSSSNSASAVSTSASADEDEERQFLLSLVSHVREVPRRHRLAMRSDIMAVIARYAGEDDAPNQR